MKKLNLLVMLLVAGAVVTSCKSEEKKDGEKKEISQELKDAIQDISDKGKTTSQEVLTFVATLQNQVVSWNEERKLDEIKEAIAANPKIAEQAASMLATADNAASEIDALLAEVNDAGMKANLKGDEFREWAQAATSGKIKEDALKGQLEDWNNVVAEMANNLTAWKAKWQAITEADKANIDALNALVSPAK